MITDSECEREGSLVPERGPWSQSRERVCENVTVHNFFLTSKDLNKKSRQKCATSRGLNPGEKFDQKAVITCPARLATLRLDFVISGLKCTYNGR